MSPYDAIGLTLRFYRNETAGWQIFPIHYLELVSMVIQECFTFARTDPPVRNSNASF